MNWNIVKFCSLNTLNNWILDAAATYAMMLRIEQWAANVKNAYNTNTYDPFHINEKDKQLRNQEEENQY